MNERTQQINKRLEHLINRKRDGALSQDEQLELDRDLVHHPEAQRLLEDYERLDALTGVALDEMVASAADSPGVLSEPVLTSRRIASSNRGYRSYSPTWWILPGAIAAALMAFAFIRGSHDPDHRSGNPPTPAGVTEHESALPRLQARLGSQGNLNGSNDLTPPVRTVSTREGNGETVQPRRRIIHDTVRDLLGVVGDDGKVYWFEVDHTRTMRSRSNDSAAKLARGDL